MRFTIYLNVIYLSYKKSDMHKYGLLYKHMIYYIKKWYIIKASDILYKVSHIIKAKIMFS